MTTKQPARRLSDVFKQTSPEFLKKSTQQAQRAMKEIAAEDIQSRFERNQFLIDPKSLQLLVDHNYLKPYRTFSLYKPPFCPMRRSDAVGNYHRVSMESFLAASLRSADIAPVMDSVLFEDSRLIERLRQQTGLARESGTVPDAMIKGLNEREPRVTVRVLNELPQYASGPLMVSLHQATLADQRGRLPTDPVASLFGESMVPSSAPWSLNTAQSVLHFEVMIFGHEVIKATEESIPVEQLFSSTQLEHLKVLHSSNSSSLDSSRSSSSSSNSSSSAFRCSFLVERIGYYSVHAVSLARVSIYAPPSAVFTSPDILSYIRRYRKTYVVGDPEGAETIQKQATFGNPLRGDFDFSRVFVHLRSLTAAVPVQQAATPSSASRESWKQLEVSCKNCFGPLIHPERSLMMKRIKMQLLDGSWSPRMI